MNNAMGSDFIPWPYWTGVWLCNKRKKWRQSAWAGIFSGFLSLCYHGWGSEVLVHALAWLYHIQVWNWALDVIEIRWSCTGTSTTPERLPLKLILLTILCLLNWTPPYCELAWTYCTRKGNEYFNAQGKVNEQGNEKVLQPRGNCFTELVSEFHA